MRNGQKEQAEAIKNQTGTWKNEIKTLGDDLAALENRQQQMLGDQFSQLAGNDGYMQQMRQQALSQLIDQALLDSYIKDLHIAISDDQVKQAIFNQAAFQTNGKFDNAKYNAMIGNMGFTADQYAEALRKQLATQQLINAIANTDFMLKNETSKLVDLVAQTMSPRSNFSSISNITYLHHERQGS